MRKKTEAKEPENKRGRPLDPALQQQRKDDLLDAAFELLREKSYRSITIRDIAEKAGMKSAMISYYFGGKEDLFIALIERLGEQQFGRIIEVIAQPDPLRGFIRAAITRIVDCPPLITFIIDEVLSERGRLQDRFIDLMPRRMAMFLPKLIEAEQKKGNLRADVDPKWAAFSLVNLIITPFIGGPVRRRAWDMSDELVSSDEWIEHVYRMFISGCGAAPQSHSQAHPHSHSHLHSQPDNMKED
ncbi:TetR/AcrR family transcriptional regulator [Hahella sp. NBU794]|uniref:TetR/AcrR family transcriptional regulator n=1 Tax=Hahella sp. NBU794 TaxID=3422590 RepID=UPI003D6FEC25